MWELLGGYGIHLAGWAGFFGGVGFFLGFVDEMQSFFRSIWEAMLCVLILDFSIFCVRFRLNAEARIAKALANNIRINR